MKEVKGYKAFNKDFTNREGMPFAEGETYSVEGEIVFGNHGNGYHMCTSLSDVFRYVKATEEEVRVALVTGKGEMVQRDDNYYGYYDMYCCESITVERFLSREEVIEIMLKSPPHEADKFLITCRITEEEAVMFARKFRKDVDVMKHLLYYHFGNKDAFTDGLNVKDEIRLVLKNGQDNC